MLTPHGHDPRRIEELERKAKDPFGWYTSGSHPNSAEEIARIKEDTARQAAELRKAEK